MPVSYQSKQLTVRAVFSEQMAGCDIGMIQLTKGKGDSLNVRFVKDGVVIWSGKLSRQ